MMRVLYVWNTAGASTPISDWLINNGHKSKIIMHSDYDTYGMTRGALSSILPTSLRGLYDTIVKTIREFQPTHIHINSNVTLVPIVRATAPFTPIIFQYHGDDVRDRKRIHTEVQFLTDRVIVSTPDLAQFGKVFGCPIDSSFYPRGGRKTGTALLIIAGNAREDKSDIALDYCKQNGLDLTVVDCRKGEKIPFAEMPEFLSSFEYYFDFKGINALSKKAMEAMSCGCKVIPEDMSEILTDFHRTTPADYVRLYRSTQVVGMVKTGLRLGLSLPWSKILIQRAKG